jgi:pyrimidine operon attenuation protein/uracil phosphoribosyltransferase
MNKPGNPLPNPLPDAEQLLARLLDQMKPVVGPDTGIIGIHTGGVWVAERLHAALGIKAPLGTLDVSFYRDDFEKIGLHRDVKTSDLPFDVEGRRLILVDDVLYTGRTIRAAMNVLFDYGRPASIQLAALVNRGGRELPIGADYLGGDISLTVSQSVELTRDASSKLSLKLHEN